MKFSKLNAEERDWFNNELCKARNKVRLGSSKLSPLNKEMIEYSELYEELQQRKKKICAKYLNK